MGCPSCQRERAGKQTIARTHATDAARGHPHRAARRLLRPPPHRGDRRVRDSRRDLGTLGAHSAASGGAVEPDHHVAVGGARGPADLHTLHTSHSASRGVVSHALVAWCTCVTHATHVTHATRVTHATHVTQVPDDPPIFRTLVKRAQTVLQARFMPYTRCTRYVRYADGAAGAQLHLQRAHCSALPVAVRAPYPHIASHPRRAPLSPLRSPSSPGAFRGR